MGAPANPSDVPLGEGMARAAAKKLRGFLRVDKAVDEALGPPPDEEDGATKSGIPEAGGKGFFTSTLPAKKVKKTQD